LKPRVLELVACPTCLAPLELEERAREGEEVMEGELTCSGCSAAYPVSGGIPRLLPGALSEEKRRTAAAFGYEWRHFTELHAQYRDQFLDWMQPIQPEFFEGKVVLDAGCGTGRHAFFAAEFGAREVVGMDLSDAVLTAFGHIGRRPNVHIVQADIYAPPLRRCAFQAIYSIGVLHHLPDPRSGFLALVPLLRPGGTIHAWVYGHENNGVVHHFINPVRKALTRHLPPPVVKGAIALPMTLILEALVRGVYGPLARTRAFDRLPSHAYLHSLGRFSFRQNHSIVFDHLIAPTAYYLRRDEFEEWFRAGGLDNVELSWRNENSWRGTGTAPSVAD
jgi:SAM-dependent methyltransferase